MRVLRKSCARGAEEAEGLAVITVKRVGDRLEVKVIRGE